jgi:glyoxylase-like metal-dependent hydrolase (beta-lactamase superfamily II)
VGPAHTRGDLIVWLPAERIVAVGDLIERGLPYAGHGYPAGWVRALERIDALDPLVIVPSHGPVLRDRSLLRAQLATFRDIVSLSRAGFCAGRTGERSAEEIVGVLARKYANSGVAAETLEEFLREATARAFEEAESDRQAACGG